MHLVSSMNAGKQLMAEAGEIVVFSFMPMIGNLDELPPDQRPGKTHSILFQAICAANAQSSNLFLGFTRMGSSGFFEFKVTSAIVQALIHQQMLSGGLLQLFSYRLTSIKDHCKTYSCMNSFLQGTEYLVN